MAKDRDIYFEGAQHAKSSFVTRQLIGLTEPRAYAESLAPSQDLFKEAEVRDPCTCAQERGWSMCELDQHEQALASFDKAIALKPDSAAAHYGRGFALSELGRYDDALNSYKKAIELNPNLTEALINSGTIYYRTNSTSKAILSYEKAKYCKRLGAHARVASCLSTLPMLYEREAEIKSSRSNYEKKLDNLISDFNSGVLGTEAIADLLPFYLAYQQFNDLDLQRKYGSLICHAMAQAYPAAKMPKPPARGEPVRVGFVSAFFQWHSNWKIPMKGWISQLERPRFKVYGYHVGQTRDAETVAAAFMCDRFVHGLTSLDQCRKEILADAPHVLIYPGLFMDRLTHQLAAQRLAPIQCNALGHPETSGMDTVDYAISSELMEPEDAAEHYSERLIKLPNLAVYYNELFSQKVIHNRAELGLNPDSIIFWCGQSLYKYLPQYDSVFAEIAEQVSSCQFAFLQNKSEGVTKQFEKRLTNAFRQKGLRYCDHCTILPRLNFHEYVSAIGYCDIILDSIGWSGNNSTMESLKHNLPVVTFEGSLMRGRHTAAILRMMGARETIATTVDDYISIAVRLGNSPSQRKAISHYMKENKHRVFCDRTCISALEEFLDSVARSASARASA